MNEKHILGIDGGASKVFSQLYIFKDNNTVIDQGFPPGFKVTVPIKINLTIAKD